MNEEMTFESAMTRLEDIARKLDNGEETLASSLSLYEEAISLIRYCTEALDTAKSKIVRLTEGEDHED